MRRLLRHLSWAVLVVMLATVLAPTFAWEAVAGDRLHTDQSEWYAGTPAPQEHHGMPEQGAAGSQHMHSCAGHAHGHLVVVHASVERLGAAGLSDELALGDRPDEPSYAPHVRLHPPQSFRLA